MVEPVDATEAAARIAVAERAIAKDPGNANAYRILAQAHVDAGDTQNAFAMYGQLADAEQQKGLYEDAIADYQSAIALYDTNPDLFNNYGVALRCLKRNEEAIAAFTSALKIDPALYSALSNRANMYWDTGDYQAAFADHRAALTARPDDAQVHVNYAVALRETGALEEALKHYDRALELQSDFALAHYDRGQLLAQMGDLKAGFTEMEWRWQPSYNYKEKSRGYKQPVWRGESPKEVRGNLQIISEQGYGDTIQFCRYAPLLAAKGHRVLLEVQTPLLRLCAVSFKHAGVHIIERQTKEPGILAQMFKFSAPPAFAAYAGMLSLPERFGTTLETVPSATPYLSVNPADTAQWAQRMIAPEKLKIGLVWQGDPTHKQDKTRSCPPALLYPLLETGDAHFYALQKGTAGDWDFPQGNVTSLGLHLSDFYDTACAIKNLDLVISIDSAVAHLAGALNCPVWIMLTKIGEWRWLTEGDTTPWYKSARLFRQQTQGQWPEVIARMAGEVKKLAAAR